MTHLPSWLPVVLIALAVVVASLRLSLLPRPRLPRLFALLALQLAAAVLLYFTLLPPTRPAPSGTLAIATAGSTAAQLHAVPATTRLRLPEAPVIDGAARVPDLATALRQHPGAREVVIVGQGLPARDRETPLPALRFIAGPAPRGLVELQPPPVLAPGAAFTVRSRVQGLPQVRVELLDPAGHRAAITTPDAQGRVQLTASARDAGNVEFKLRVLDADGKVVDQLPVPVHVREQQVPSLRLLAGAPGPELKYLQRWASDIGAPLQTSIVVGGGVQLGDAPAALDAASLAKLDLLVLDERRLASLSSAQRAAITQAVHDGLGVLVRVSGTLDASARTTLRSWGLPAHGGQQMRAMKLAGTGDAADSKQLTLERFNLDVTGTDVAPLLRDAEGQPVGGWRAMGLGRIGLLPVTDSYTLVLTGHAEQHAQLWNAVLATLARPLPSSVFAKLPAWGWRGERLSLCGLPASSQLQDADGNSERLVADPGADNCMAAWPKKAGWLQVRAGDAQAEVFLLDPEKAPALHAQQMREATQALVSRGNGQATWRVQQVPTSRWPWLLGFVLVAALLWWLERRRASLQ